MEHTTTAEIPQPTTVDLEAGVHHVQRAPADRGTLDLVVARPTPGERAVLEIAELDLDEGLVGDNWRARGSRRTPDGGPDHDKQLNVMNVRAALLAAQDPDRIPLAGDQLYVDLDLSVVNLPAGTHLGIGSAVIEVTASPHTGCAKFTQRFGLDTQRFFNSEVGRALRLRGLCAKVVVPGTIRRGDTITVTRSPH